MHKLIVVFMAVGLIHGCSSSNTSSNTGNPTSASLGTFQGSCLHTTQCVDYYCDASTGASCAMETADMQTGCGGTWSSSDKCVTASEVGACTISALGWTSITHYMKATVDGQSSCTAATGTWSTSG